MAAAAGLKRRGAEEGLPGVAKVLKQEAKAEALVTQAAAASSAGGKKAGKGKGGKAAAFPFDKGYTTLVQQVARLSLANSRELALVKSVVVQTVLFSRDTKAGKVAETVKKTTEDHFAATKKINQQEKSLLGSPHVFAWLEALDFWLGVCKQVNNEPLRKLIEAHIGEMMEKATAALPADKQDDQALKQKLYRDEVQKVCKVFKVIKCWNPEMARMEITPSPGLMTTLYPALIDFMTEHAKANVKTSQAPKTDTERKIGKALDRLKGDMEVDTEERELEMTMMCFHRR
eukprot:TRINITY_DN21107_c0_g1_i1.p1 TRINITY_DN21107_c0_g1~~TRINITY_DN21107_c0_g1_i1.p1  ORF type:complete len:288 (-),score=110.47 TRINITY_DN21107_c0_g1_i1:355-1218(-)